MIGLALFHCCVICAHEAVHSQCCLSGSSVCAGGSQLRLEPSITSIGGRRVGREGIFRIRWLSLSGFDGRGRYDLVLCLVGFILDCDVCRSECSSEGRKGCQGVAAGAACGTVKFHRSVQFGCVNCQMASCYERVHTYSAAHYVVTDLVDQRVRCFRFREAHVSVANRRQGRTKDKVLVKKI